MPKTGGTLTKAQLGREADKQLRENARELLKKYFVAVDKKLQQGDNRTIEMVSRMFQFDKGPGGVTIFNQHLQVTAQQPQEQTARVRSFDQIIGKLEDTDKVRALLAQPEEESDIQDAEVEDIAAA